jgi:hypothetical protein
MPFRNQPFEPDIIAVMAAAYERTCSAILPGPHAELAKEMVAKRIIELAKQGCNDPDRLCSEVLKVFGLERPPVEGGASPLSPTAH